MILATIWQLSYWTSEIGPNVLATILCAIPTLALSYAKVIKPLLTHIRESRAHQHWQARQTARHLRALGIEPEAHPNADISVAPKGS